MVSERKPPDHMSHTTFGNISFDRSAQKFTTAPGSTTYLKSAMPKGAVNGLNGGAVPIHDEVRLDDVEGDSTSDSQ